MAEHDDKESLFSILMHELHGAWNDQKHAPYTLRGGAQKDPITYQQFVQDCIDVLYLINTSQSRPKLIDNSKDFSSKLMQEGLPGAMPEKEKKLAVDLLKSSDFELLSISEDETLHVAKLMTFLMKVAENVSPDIQKLLGYHPNMRAAFAHMKHKAVNAIYATPDAVEILTQYTLILDEAIRNKREPDHADYSFKLDFGHDEDSLHHQRVALSQSRNLLGGLASGTLSYYGSDDDLSYAKEQMKHLLPEWAIEIDSFTMEGSKRVSPGLQKAASRMMDRINPTLQNEGISSAYSLVKGEIEFGESAVFRGLLEAQSYLDTNKKSADGSFHLPEKLVTGDVLGALKQLAGTQSSGIVLHAESSQCHINENAASQIRRNWKQYIAIAREQGPDAAQTFLAQQKTTSPSLSSAPVSHVDTTYAMIVPALDNTIHPHAEALQELVKFSERLEKKQNPKTGDRYYSSSDTIHLNVPDTLRATLRPLLRALSENKSLIEEKGGVLIVSEMITIQENMALIQSELDAAKSALGKNDKELAKQKVGDAVDLLAALSDQAPSWLGKFDEALKVVNKR